MEAIQIIWGPISEDTVDVYNAFTIQDLFDENRNFTLKSILESNDSPKPFLLAHEDYGFVKEFVYEYLPIVIKSLFAKGVIDECFVQNPPKLLLESFKRKFDCTENIYYNYNKIDDEKFTKISDTLNSKILGQEDALQKVISTLYLSKAAITEKPLVIMLYGPEGIGKTETAKIISETIYGQSMFRKQFSMFQTTNFMDYMFGNSENQNSFARELLVRKTNILLLDEFDKCPPVFYSAFYQLFDEGVFVDRNYEVDMKNTVIICTSNFKNKDEIKDFLGGPIYSRFDAVIQYSPLSTEVKEKIIKDSYQKNLNLFSQEDKMIIENENLLEQLIIRANAFKNVREIDKLIKLLMARKCAEKFLDRQAEKE